jgi:hypothetical protein
VPRDYSLTLNETVEIAGDQTTLELDAGTQLFMFEFNRITKTGGINNPFVTIELPGIQIPQTIINNLLDKSLKCNFITYIARSERESSVYVMREGPRRTRARLHKETDTKNDFLRYAIDLQCLNPVASTRKMPLPLLEDLAE